ncbi:MAG: RNA methyltransferase [Candidatus Bathyarchaeota archaeon]|nr:RNA methyltransferase [Candidatus Bathyarchaeota archaeon]
MECRKLVFRQKLSIAIPASLVTDIPHLREKTLRIGMLGRSVALFGVDEVILFSDLQTQRQTRGRSLIASILSYMETPQYLRKQLFKIRPDLKYVGVLPPLRTAHHPLASRIKDLATGQYREGIVISSGREGTLVDIGVEDYARIRTTKLPVNSRVTVRIKRVKKILEAEATTRREVGKYWGYQVSQTDSTLGKLLRRRSFDLVIATSKYGKPIQDVSNKLTMCWKTSRRILVAFGAPARGLYEIVKQEKLDLDEIADFVVNTIPYQEVQTVRTEEAVPVTLAILRLLAAKG